MDDTRIKEIRDNIKETNIGTKDLDTLCEELVEVRAKWWLIGLKLRLTPGTLDEIKQEKTNRLEAVLLHWLRVTIGASWEQLIDALRSAQVGEIQLAEKLELKYCLPEKTGHGEKRKYRSDDEQQLTNDIKNIKKKFANLQATTKECEIQFAMNNIVMIVIIITHLQLPGKAMKT